MTLNRIKRLSAVAFVGVLLLFGVGTMTTAHAQHRVVVRPRVFVFHRAFVNPWWGYPYYPYYADPIAYEREQGYSDGLSRGKDDAKHGRADDPNSHSHYRNSSSITYRDAFVQGYNDGFNGERVREH